MIRPNLGRFAARLNSGTGAQVSSLLLVRALAAEPAASPVPASSPVIACTAERLRAFVGPMGVRQPWPVAPELPPHLAPGFGELLPDAGLLACGYMQTLHVDASALIAYAAQQGGFAGSGLSTGRCR